MGVREKNAAKGAPSTPVSPAASADTPIAAAEISKIIDTPVARTSETLRDDTRLTQRWTHGAIHDSLPGMRGHVVMTYYGAAKEIEWRSGSARQKSRTRPGSITLIPEGHDGNWNIEGPLEVSHVYLTEQRLQHIAELLGGGRVELLDRIAFDDMAAAHILEMLSQSAVTNDPASRLFVEQAVDLLCTQLIRAHSSIGALQPAEPRRGLVDWQVKRVTGYMREFIDRDIGLEELSRLVGLSQFHFCTAFRLAVGNHRTIF